MGIHNLLKLIIKHNDRNNMTEIEQKTNIYCSNSVYVDVIFVLLKIYNQYPEKFINITQESLDNVLAFVAEKLTEQLTSYQYYNKNVYVFIDIHQIQKFNVRKIYFNNYLPTLDDFDEEEILLSTPMIEKKYVNNIENFDESDVICYYELSSRDAKLKNINANDYISIHQLPKSSKTNTIISHAWIRYLMLRGAKIAVKKERQSTNKGNFRLLIHNFPLIISKMNMENVQYFACTSESDFAIVKHIKMYNKNNYPTIITNDTDLLCLLCDINCVLKIYNQYNGKYYTINPIKFWHQVFNTTLHPEIIKILCVLCGTNYNYNKKITINDLFLFEFHDILTLMKLQNFHELTIEKLKLYIFEFVHKNNNIHNRRTMLAYNIYINNDDILCPIIYDDTILEKIKESSFI